MQTLLKAFPGPIFRLTDLGVRTLAGFRKPLVFVNRVSEGQFIKLLTGFSKLNMTVNILSAAYREGFHIHNRFTETRIKLSVSGFSKDLHN